MEQAEQQQRLEEEMLEINNKQFVKKREFKHDNKI